MTNGINTTLDEFKSMSDKGQRAALFHNTEKILFRLEGLDKRMDNHEKVDWKIHIGVGCAIIIMAAVIGYKLPFTTWFGG